MPLPGIIQSHAGVLSPDALNGQLAQLGRISIGDIQGGDKGTGRNRTDAGERRQAFDCWIVTDQGFEVLVRADKFRVEDVDHLAQRRQSRDH